MAVCGNNGVNALLPPPSPKRGYSVCRLHISWLRLPFAAGQDRDVLPSETQWWPCFPWNSLSRFTSHTLLLTNASTLHLKWKAMFTVTLSDNQIRLRGRRHQGEEGSSYIMQNHFLPRWPREGEVASWACKHYGKHIDKRYFVYLLCWLVL